MSSNAAMSAVLFNETRFHARSAGRLVLLAVSPLRHARHADSDSETFTSSDFKFKGQGQS